MNGKTHYRLGVALVLATLALRAAIPAGFMPAAVGSGLPFEMCPSAVPAEILSAMSGAWHHHHHGGHDAKSDGRHFDAGSCPLGQLLSTALAFDHLPPANIAPALAPLSASEPGALRSFDQPVSRSRDPPA